MHQDKDWRKKFQSDPELSWSEFLTDYNSQILRNIGNIFPDPDQKMNAYSDILDRLKSENYRRIFDYYKQARVYNFKIWLSVVVRNLCYDYLRKTKGRYRFPQYVQSRPHCDQLLFKYIYWRQYPPEIIMNILKMNHGYTGSLGDMQEKLDDISRHIDEKSQISTPGYKSEVSLNQPHFRMKLSNSDLNTVEEDIIAYESKETFSRIFGNLDSIDQLILKLHFLYGKSLKEIAMMVKLKNIWQVHRRMKKALIYLNTQFKMADISIEDLQDEFLK